MLFACAYILGRFDFFRVACVQYEDNLPVRRVLGVKNAGDLVLLERISIGDFDNVSAEIEQRVNAQYSKDSSDWYRGDPWMVRAMLRSILYGELVITERKRPRIHFAYIYLLHLPEFTFKIGMTRRGSLQRLQDYRHREFLYIGQVPTDHVVSIETQIKDLYRFNFTLVKGTEYFTGDWRKMLQLLHKVVDDVETCIPPDPPLKEHVPWDRTVIATLRNALHRWLLAHRRDHVIILEEKEMLEALRKQGLECGNKSTYWWESYCRNYLVLNFENRGLKWPIQNKIEENGTSVWKIRNCYQIEPVTMLELLKTWV
jgi:hypothetical protein